MATFLRKVLGAARGVDDGRKLSQPYLTFSTGGRGTALIFLHSRHENCSPCLIPQVTFFQRKIGDGGGRNRRGIAERSTLKGPPPDGSAVSTYT